MWHFDFEKSSFSVSLCSMTLQLSPNTPPFYTRSLQTVSVIPGWVLSKVNHPSALLDPYYKTPDGCLANLSLLPLGVFFLFLYLSKTVWTHGLSQVITWQQSVRVGGGHMLRTRFILYLLAISPTWDIFRWLGCSCCGNNWNRKLVFHATNLTTYS